MGAGADRWAHIHIEGLSIYLTDCVAASMVDLVSRRFPLLGATLMRIVDDVENKPLGEADLA